jgi:heptosyltransferase-2
MPTMMERYYLDRCAGSAVPRRASRRLFVEAEAERECESRMAASGLHKAAPLVCLAPGAGFGPSKLWPLEYVAEVARELLDSGAQVALVHGPGEQALAHEILARTGPGLVSLGGEGMTLSLLKSCSRAPSS